jgi:hypothetical protein
MQRTPERFDALANGPRRCAVRKLAFVGSAGCGKAPAVVMDHDLELAIARVHQHAGTAVARMAHDVRQALAHDLHDLESDALTGRYAFGSSRGRLSRRPCPETHAPTRAPLR